MSNVAFDTPTISFEQEVTSPVETSVAIDAMFTQLGSGTGSIDPDGNVNVRVALRVDLDLRVAIAAGVVFRCTATPVVLDLASTSPHDGETVTLRAGNFSVPPVAVTDDCIDLIAGAVNDQLAGGGHSLTLGLVGGLTRPPEPGEPTVTALAVSPAGGAGLGEPVTLTATVAMEDDELEGIPQGLVEFRDGNTSLGLGELDAAGVASLETTGLSAGPRRLTARFLGAPPDFGASTSAEVIYAITAGTTLTADVPATVRTGGDAIDFDLTTINPGFGAALTDVRVDVTIQRPRHHPRAFPGSGPIGPDGATPRIELIHVVGDDEHPVGMVHSVSGGDQRLDGTIGDPAGWALAPGASRVDALRLRVAAGVSPGPIQITFTLVQVDPDTEDPVATLATGAGQTTMVETQRRASQITGGSLLPVAARQGTFVSVINPNVGPAVDGVGPYGEVEFAIDGRPVLAQRIQETGAWLPRMDAMGAGASMGAIALQVPPDTPVGMRTVTATFLGDPVFGPSQASWPLRIEAALGTVYNCSGGVTLNLFSMLVDVTAGLPAVSTPGAVLPLGDLRVDIRAPRGRLTDDLFGQFLIPPQLMTRTVDFAFGPGGTGTASDEITRQYTGRMTSEDGQSIDDFVRFTNPEGEVVIDGEPGQTIDVTLEEIVFGFDFQGLVTPYRCVPADAGATAGRVTVAGTTLAADTTAVREGEPVTLDAQRLPVAAGSIEFLANGAPIAHVGAPEGRAVTVVDDLPAGTHEITARFLGGLTDPVTTSEPVEVVVAPGPLCEGFLHSGNGATVRLVYLELLRRCPDQVGFDYWVDRLDSFASTPEQFARSIARTPEAVGVVVNDGYQTMLGRNAEAAGKAFWVDRMISGTGRYDQLLADLGASDEFWSKAGSTNTGFVERVYDRLLRRTPDQAGSDYWVERLEGGASRRALILSLANLDEPLGVLVAQSYAAMLDWAPDTDERSAAITFLRSTGDRSALYAQLIGEPEFATRAQGFPNP